jgi:hypothetical protein
MVGESVENHEQHAVEGPGRVKFPDDPDIRVELSENCRAELARRDPEEIARQMAKLRGGSRLHPTSITRYVQGKIAPKLSVARNLAKVLDWPLTEVVAGYSRRYGWPSLDWGRVLLYARTFRKRAVAFLEMFRDVIVPNTHFGFPNDRACGWRHQVRPARSDTGYACFEVILDEPVGAGRPPFDIVLSYCLFERPRVFIDFGRITVTPGEVSSVEVWTRRHDRAILADGARSFWVATWIDGKAVDFIVRSSKAFGVSPIMVPEADLPPGPRAVVRFKPGPIHKYDLAECDDAETAP